jgi:hypothetical protein
MMPNENQSGNGVGVKDFFRTIGTFLGFGMIGFGFYWTAKLFFLASGIFREPQKAAPILKAWKEVLGSGALNISVDKVAISIDPQLMTLLLIGGGVCFLILVTTQIASAGIQLLTAMVTDTSAIKKILTSWAANFLYRQPDSSSPNKPS